MHRGVWLPGRGKKPFFPLCPCRTAGPTRPENSARLPPSRHAAYAPSGIIHLRSQHFASSLQDSCSNSLHAARFVVLGVYDTVVIEGRCYSAVNPKSERMHLTERIKAAHPQQNGRTQPADARMTETTSLVDSLKRKRLPKM